MDVSRKSCDIFFATQKQIDVKKYMPMCENKFKAKESPTLTDPHISRSSLSISKNINDDRLKEHGKPCSVLFMTASGHVLI